MAHTGRAVNGVEGVLLHIAAEEIGVCFAEIVVDTEKIYIVVIVQNKGFPIFRGDDLRPDIAVIKRLLADTPAAQIDRLIRAQFIFHDIVLEAVAALNDKIYICFALSNGIADILGRGIICETGGNGGIYILRAEVAFQSGAA